MEEVYMQYESERMTCATGIDLIRPVTAYHEDRCVRRDYSYSGSIIINVSDS